MNGKIMLNGKAYSSSGRPSREVTMSEWLALPDTKYTDGIVYYIKDVGGANQFPPLIYSDEEREVGVWRDGKPLYQRTINVDFVNGRRDYQHGIQNVDMIFFDDSATFIYAKDKSEFNHFYNAGYNDSAQFVEGYGRFIQQVTPTIVILKANPNIGSNYSAIITLRYTKTTDTAGSGTWNQQGGYAHHYDNVEKVIGTFFGKPLYERSWDLGADVSLPNDRWTSLGIPNDGTIDLITANYGTSEWGIIRAISTSSKVDANYIVSMSTRNGTEVVRYITLQYTKTTD